MTTPSTRKDIERDSISVSLVEAALRCAKVRGVSRKSLLAAADIAPAMLESPRARVSPVQYGRLWNATADAFDDEFFGQDAHPMRRGSFVLLCHAALTSRDGAQALARIAGFMRVVLDELRFEPDIGDDRVRIWLDDTGEPKTMFAYATGFILVYGLLCWLLGRRIPVLAAHLRCPEPDASDEYRLMFCDDLRFGEPRSFVDLSGRVRGPAHRADDGHAQALPACRAREFHREVPQSGFARSAHQDASAPDRAIRLARSGEHRGRAQHGGSHAQAPVEAGRADLSDDQGRAAARSRHRAARAYWRDDSADRRCARLRGTKRVPAFRKWTGVRPADYRRQR